MAKEPEEPRPRNGPRGVGKAPRHRGIEASRHQGIEASRHQGTVAPGHTWQPFGLRRPSGPPSPPPSPEGGEETSGPHSGPYDCTTSRASRTRRFLLASRLRRLRLRAGSFPIMLSPHTSRRLGFASDRFKSPLPDQITKSPDRHITTSPNLTVPLCLLCASLDLR